MRVVLLFESALIAETPIVTKKYVISLTLIVSVLNLRIAKIANKPNANPKSNFTLLSKKHNKNWCNQNNKSSGHFFEMSLPLNENILTWSSIL